jgi:SAM-dependent methyltransferase
VTAGPPAGASAYSSGIYARRPPRLPRVVEAVQRIASRLPLRALAGAGVRPGAAVLDAGAGRGRLLAALRERGYDADGIDVEPRADDVRRAGIEEHEASGLDAVVVWHVLEHVPDPAAALARIRGWLRPDGVVLVGVPNLDSLQARIAGPAWFHLDLPRHRTHFTARGVRELMRGAGVEPERVRQLVPEHNFHGMWFALLSRVGMSPGFPFHLVKRNAHRRPRDLALLAVAGPLLIPPAIALELVAVALRRGGTIAVTGRVQARA